ncbi:MAG: hypothetical protein ACE366_29635 [Bradymonadia bacterium]
MLDPLHLTLVAAVVLLGALPLLLHGRKISTHRQAVRAAMAQCLDQIVRRRTLIDAPLPSALVTSIRDMGLPGEPWRTLMRQEAELEMPEDAEAVTAASARVTATLRVLQREIEVYNALVGSGGGRFAAGILGLEAISHQTDTTEVPPS